MACKSGIVGSEQGPSRDFISAKHSSVWRSLLFLDTERPGPFVCARQPGTGEAGRPNECGRGQSCGELLSGEPSQRTPRCRPRFPRLEVRASPSGDRATGNRSRKPKPCRRPVTWVTAVMPLDVLGRTRATLIKSASFIL